MTQIRRAVKRGNVIIRLGVRQQPPKLTKGNQKVSFAKNSCPKLMHFSRIVSIIAMHRRPHQHCHQQASIVLVKEVSRGSLQQREVREGRNKLFPAHTSYNSYNSYISFCLVHLCGHYSRVKHLNNTRFCEQCSTSY